MCEKVTSSLNLLIPGVAPGGVYTALYITIQAVSSYLAFSSLPHTWRLFSVALSLRFPSQDVILHHCSMGPGLSSYAAFRPCYTRLSDLLYLIFYSFFYKKSIILLLLSILVLFVLIIIFFNKFTTYSYFKLLFICYKFFNL